MTTTAGRKKTLWRRLRQEKALHLMMIPPLLFLLVFSYLPMGGIIIAFQKYSPAKGILGSKWVGLQQFRYVFKLPTFLRVIQNTFFIACAKIILTLVCTVTFALLLNEVRNKFFKKLTQTVTYLPHFLSWVILGGIFVDILSPSSGVVNLVLKWFGKEPVFFLGDPKTLPWTVIITDVWKELGFGAVVYIAALTAIDPTYYEAAVIDGATRWQQTIYVTLPAIAPTIVLMATLSMGNVLNAGFDQVYNLYSIAVYSTGDIIDTFVYRLGLEDFQFSASTAVGLFKSLISTTLIVTSYKIADWTTGYKII